MAGRLPCEPVRVGHRRADAGAEVTVGRSANLSQLFAAVKVRVVGDPHENFV